MITTFRRLWLNGEVYKDSLIAKVDYVAAVNIYRWGKIGHLTCKYFWGQAEVLYNNNTHCLYRVDIAPKSLIVTFLPIFSKAHAALYDINELLTPITRDISNVSSWIPTLSYLPFFGLLQNYYVACNQNLRSTIALTMFATLIQIPAMPV